MLSVLLPMLLLPGAPIQTHDFGRPLMSYQRDVWQPHLPELREAFGTNKRIPEQYALEILLALSYFPDLAEAHIHFKPNNKVVPATSRPKIVSLFGSKRARRYLITISESDVWGDSKAMIKNQSMDARIGLIGHELTHTDHYHRKSLGGIISMAFTLLTPKGRARFERRTDERAVEHGLGYQLHRWARELRNEQDQGFDWLDRFYLTPPEIEKAMTQSPLYKDVDTPTKSDAQK